MVTLCFLLLFLSGCNREDIVVSNLTGNRITALGHAGMGLSGSYPTNSAESILKSLEIGLDGTELDVQMTADSVLVAFHDADLSQTTNLNGMINNLRWEDLKEGKYNREPFSNYQIVSLDELFARIQNPGRYTFTFDCKLYTQKQDRATYHAMFVRAIVRLAESYSLKSNLCIESQDRGFLSIFSTYAPDYQLFIYPGNFDDGLQTALDLNLFGITIDNDLITKEQVALAHTHGLRIALWGVHSRNQNEDAVSKDPDYIQTDRPRNLLDLLGR